MKQYLDKLFNNQDLSREEAQSLMQTLTQEDLNLAQASAILSAYRFKVVNAEEILGFRTALLDLALKPEIKFDNLLDVCGTGGDEKDTFNISTLTALVLAGADQKVAKHGNYSFSSKCGSSNVLENLGVKFSNDPDFLNRALEQANICFLHAPLFHPALKIIGPVRKQLGFRTIFNLLGPLVNPLEPQYQFTGVANAKILKLYEEVLSQTDSRYMLNYSYDGYDEISLTGHFIVAGNVLTKEYLPEELDLKRVDFQDLNSGKSIEEATKVFQSILSAEGTFSQNQVVLTNAAFALILTSHADNFFDAYKIAEESLMSKKALRALETLIEIGNKHG